MKELIPTATIERFSNPAKVTTWVFDKLDIVGELKLEAMNTAIPIAIEVIRRLQEFGLEFGYKINIRYFKNKALCEAYLRVGKSNPPFKIPENCPKTHVKADSEVNRLFSWILHRLEEYGVCSLQATASAIIRLARVVSWFDKFKLPVEVNYQVEGHVIDKKVKSYLLALIKAGEGFRDVVK
ncbi:hypothetical protein DRO97_10625, partial [Archaeoglobales archaeon]